MSLVGGKISSLLSRLNLSQADDIDVSRRHRPDYKIVLYMGLLMLIGLIIIYAIGPQRANVLNNSYGSEYSDSYFFVKQTISLGLALLAFALLAYLPYKLLISNASKILLLGLIACGILAVAGWANLGIAQASLGAVGWFNLGLLGSLQPAEILKFGLVIFTAGFVGVKAMKGKVNNKSEEHTSEI